MSIITRKPNVVELHNQYKNNQITADEYSRQLRIALCQYLIADDVQEKLYKANLNVLHPTKDNIPDCSDEDMLAIAKELSRTQRALQLLKGELSVIPENPGVLYVPNKYRGVNIISHQDWYKFYDTAQISEYLNAVTQGKIYKKELYLYFVYDICMQIVITTHQIALTYENLLKGGANIV